MRVITRNEMAWDKHHEQYITTYQESYDFGHSDIDECKGGGAKGIIGLIGAIAIPFAAPLIAQSLVTSQIIAASSQVFASTLIGAGLGGALGFATGGLKGGLLGAIGGGAGGYFNSGFGSSAAGSGGAGLATPIGSSGLDASGNAIGAASASGIGGSAISGPLGPIAGDFTGLATDGLGATANAGLVGVNNFGQSAPLLSTGGTGVSGATLSPLTDTAAGLSVNGAAPIASDATTSGGLFSNLSPNLQQAGIKLGTQALGNALTPTPSGAGLQAQADYLNKIQAQGDRAFTLNNIQNDARNKDASNVETIAANYDPQYLGNNAATASKNRDNAAWAETEARLRTAGYSDQAIAAERNRFDTQSSQNTGTAYTGGVSAGTQQQAGLYTTGAGIRQNTVAPDANLATAYQSLAAQRTANKTAAGNAIQDAFGAVLPSPTIGAKKTTNTNSDPTVAQGVN